jgi:tetratricopeptide (TPR) repeat protein
VSVSLVPPLADPFLARQQVRHDMLTHVEECRAAGRPCRLNLHGMEGLGVSSLATRFHRDNRRLLGEDLVWLPGRTPDGQPTPPAELLRQLLRWLGVAAADQPNTEAELAASAVRLLAGAQRMIVVDDLAATEQLRGLLVPDAPRVVLVATTPSMRRELRQEGFAAFSPEFLSDVDGRELFRGVLGGTAVPEPVLTSLVAQCGGIPLQIKVLAAQIDDAEFAEALLAELRAARLDLLSLDDERRMARFLDVAYQALEDGAAYRRLALLPGRDFGVELAAAALNVSPWDARRVLRTLTDHNLLVAAGGRYSFNPIVRADARARAGAQDDEPTRRGVVRRAITWLAREALPRGRSGRWWIDSVTEALNSWYDGNPPEFSRDESLAWFEAEWENLADAVPLAAKYGLDELVVPLCVGQWKFLHSHRKLDAWFETHRVGLAVARERGDEAGVLQLASQLGAAYLEIGDTDAAAELFAESLATARRLGHAAGEQSALEWRGKIAARAGRHDEAIEWFDASAEFVDQAGEAIPEAQRPRMLALLRLQRSRSEVDLAKIAAAKGDTEAAAAWFAAARSDAEPAKAWFDGEHDDEVENQGKIRLVLGQALLGLGEDAVAVFAAAVERFRDVPRLTAEANVWLGKALAATGQPSATPLRAAIDYYDSVGNATADEVRQLLP